MIDRLEALCAQWEAYVRDQPDKGKNHDGYYAGHDACALQLRDLLNNCSAPSSPVDDARMVALVALEPFADLARIIATDHPGWDHDDFEVARIDGSHSGYLLTLAPFRQARVLLDAASQEAKA